jgi:bacterioferritin-associated ferredoxin
MGILVNSCVCQRQPFSRLLSLAREHSWDLPALTAATGCGAQCGLCVPYLARMLVTGETEFRELITAP